MAATVRGCSTSSPAAFRTPAAGIALSRAAVTAATSRGGSTPSAGIAQASGLTADPAHNRAPFAGRAQLASQTHPPSVDASYTTTAGAIAIELSPLRHSIRTDFDTTISKGTTR